MPRRKPEDLDLGAERRIWSDWHRQHAGALRSAWDGWWTGNRDVVAIR